MELTFGGGFWFAWGVFAALASVIVPFGIVGAILERVGHLKEVADARRRLRVVTEGLEELRSCYYRRANIRLDDYQSFREVYDREFDNSFNRLYATLTGTLSVELTGDGKLNASRGEVSP